MKKALGLAVLLAIPQTVAAHHTQSHSLCAPVEYIWFGGFFELLNDPAFNGTHSSCTTSWSSASVTTSAACSNHKVAVLTPGAGYFSQNFTVPADSTGILDLRVVYADIGTPASTGDRIVFELYEGSTLRDWISLYTIGASPCHTVDRGFGSTSFAGKTLQLRVWAPFVTPGVAYHIDTVQIFTYFD